MNEHCRHCNHRAALIARDGKPYCKKHADRLPTHMRRQPGKKSNEPTRRQARTTATPYRAWT